jgi:hypothetical protein
MTNFRVKNNIIRSVLAGKIIFICLKIKLYNFKIFVATKNGMTKNLFPLLFWCCCCLDPGSGMDKNRVGIQDG